MGRFVKGEVVVMPFPFSDLSRAKRRPALVLAELEGEDRILCQITSQPVRDRDAISLAEVDFEVGGLRQARPSLLPAGRTGFAVPGRGPPPGYVYFQTTMRRC